ncbi:MAG: DeoR family transcriptional regulator [Candidatus Aenigmarchaeota archaeon]|nr:DeoR family transcriptional regulator [Candidatus Aenigmarchaeota archaeon]
MDKRGTGILRMNKFCDEWNLPNPELKEKTGYFAIRFVNPLVHKIPEIDETGLNERQKEAIEYLKSKGKITNKEYRRLNLGITDKTVFRDLQDLVNKKVIMPKGKKRGGTMNSLNNISDTK